MSTWDYHICLQVGAKMPIARSTSRTLLTAEDKYINWMNDHLKASGKYVEDLEDSLADGTLIIRALEVISMNNYLSVCLCV